MTEVLTHPVLEDAEYLLAHIGNLCADLNKVPTSVLSGVHLVIEERMLPAMDIISAIHDLLTEVQIKLHNYEATQAGGL